MRNQLGRNIIEQEGQRVLTTAQLAETYNTDVKVISNNFTRNADRYTEGKHFIRLTGEGLKQFKAIHQFDEQLKFANTLYLWTEKGAWLHAKSLNTDAAWDAYEMLVDEYYRVIQQKPLTAREQALLALQVNEETAQRVDVIEEKIEVLSNTMRIDGVEQARIYELGKNKVIKVLGGYKSPVYNELARKTFHQLWREFKRYFMLPRYSELPKAQLERGIQFINIWEPDAALKMEILSVQRQITFEEAEGRDTDETTHFE